MARLLFRSIVPVALLIAACGDPPPDHPPPDALERGVDALSSELLGGGQVLGFSVAVLRGTDPVLARGYGFKSLGRQSPSDADTVYPIASVTKLVTAAVVLKLAEERKLSLEDEVTRYLPELGGRWDGVRISHLLNHTSGIPDFTRHFDTRAFETGILFDHAEAIQWTRNASPQFPVGSRWSYTNTAFYLAGVIVERVTGKTYGEVVTERVVEPLALTRTAMCFDSPLEGQWRIHHVGEGKLQEFRFLNAYPTFADGGLCSTVPELAQLVRGVFTGRLLQPGSLEAMVAPTPTAFGNVDYGLGVRRGRLEQHQKLGHTGGHVGMWATATYYPGDDLTVVVLMNTDPGDVANAPEIEARVARLALQLEPSWKEVPLTPAQMARYVGTFEIVTPEYVRRYRRFVSDGRLFEQSMAAGSEPAPLKHLGNGVFGERAWGELRLVSPPGETRVDTIVETWGGLFGDIAYRVP